jgi:3-deoxy-manno-octulosonate cytidylyltransferase (CMP-KDO synthetase)
MKKTKKFVIIIPARFQSSRFPGKPLVDINGKVLLQHVYDKCVGVVKKKLIFVATDDLRIFNYCKLNNIQCLMTSKKCKTGTDRIFEISKKIKASNYINIQGDEPLVEKANIRKFLRISLRNKNEIFIAQSKISPKNAKSTNIPKIVTNNKDELLYISRATIPGNKDFMLNKTYFGQVNLYSFPSVVLKKNLLNIKSKNEVLEDIEILRFLDNGFKINVVKLKSNNHPVDVPSDIKIVKKLLKKRY